MLLGAQKKKFGSCQLVQLLADKVGDPVFFFLSNVLSLFTSSYLQKTENCFLLINRHGCPHMN